MKSNSLIRSRRKKLEMLIAQNRLPDAKRYCEQLLESGSRDSKILVMLGTVCRRLGNNVEAEQRCRAALQLSPNLAEAYHVLGTALQCQGRIDEAVKNYRKAIYLSPHLAETHYLLGNALREQGLLEQAAHHYRETLKIDPDNVPALSNLGGTLTGLFQYEEAIRHLNKANRLWPSTSPVLCNIGRVLQLTGKPKEAEAHYREALRHDPGAVDVMVMYAELLEKSNRLDEADEILKRGLETAPGHAGLLLISAKLARRNKRYKDAIDFAQTALKGSPAADMQNELHHLLGLLYDRDGDTVRAFEHFTEGNRITASAVSDRDRHSFLLRVDQHRDEFRTVLPLLVGASHSDSSTGQSPVPVFLVGFPRSGTTLLEQILDSHPRLRSLDERPTVGAMMTTLENIIARRSEARIAITDEERAEARDRYFKRAGEFVRLEPGQLLVDKFPLNLINAWHIWRVFPDAKFILAIRHPCDVCLSCFMQNFALNDAMMEFTNLADTATLYASVMDLWKEFTENLPLRYHMLRYEDLIENVEQEARRLLDFLELEWSDEVLGHVEHARQRGTISTPSYHQVTQPIYMTAKYRWKRYATQLEPVMESLHPFIERFDY